MKELSIQNINATAPYEVVMEQYPNTYRFMTMYGVDIAISFDIDDLLESGESYQFNITNVNKKKSPSDIKVRDTVITIIDDFFEQNQASLLYICETGDNKQSMRNRLFESWFAYANIDNRYTIMAANINDEEGIDNYAALIVRKDNPNFINIVSEFNQTVNLFRIKPDTLI